ncbi:PIN domain-containing protein [Mucilaginibacter terrae]|uniref:Nucleic acid-binding protein n=1 Tax=Mucilaginibacter terrae TaxID=1955052 RepID=A0ABU3GYX4_9SPHI|nr:PIN domain-containing protein [Mucilaginibacter terrae]MDT3404167.1 putative nucleic acid-binding protein [Mucilaginibacter terrae]
MASKKVFVDSDIILDLLLKREPFFRFSQTLLNAADKYSFTLYTSTLVIANVHYFLNKSLKDKATARLHIKLLAEIIAILSVVTAEDIDFAINSNNNDFEDAIQISVAENAKADIIITRNTKDYKHSTIPVLTAEQFLRTL